MKLKVGLIGAGVLTLAGCHVQQAYHPPAAPKPPAYQEQAPASFQESKQWAKANPADTFSRGHWWEIFKDPVLNSLEERVDTANENLKSAAARYQQARAFVRERRADRFPTVTAGTSATRNRLSLNQPLAPAPGTNTFGDFSLPVDVSWEADVWGRIRSEVQSAAEKAQASAADVEAMRLSLHSELALDYFDLRSADLERRILDDAVRSYERAAELTRNRFEGGVATRVDLEEALTQLESARAQATDLLDQRARYEHAMAVLTGQTPEGFKIEPQIERIIPPVIPAGVPSALLERRPDIAAAERRVAAANTQIGIARAAFYPEVLLGASLGLQGSSITNWLNWPSRFWAIGPSALQTVFDAGRRRAVLQESTANYDALVSDYRQNVLSAFQQVEDNLASLRVLEREAESQRLAVRAAQRSEELSMNRYTGGLVTYLEVATAQAIRLQNERIAVDVERRRMEASVLLVKALGGGWDANTLPATHELMSSR